MSVAVSKLLARSHRMAGPPRRVRVQGRRTRDHLHGDHAADFGFPKDMWTALFDEGRIGYHPVFRGRAGFGARRIETEGDVDDVIALMPSTATRDRAYGVPSGTIGLTSRPRELAPSLDRTMNRASTHQEPFVVSCCCCVSRRRRDHRSASWCAWGPGAGEMPFARRSSRPDPSPPRPIRRSRP
jgi:Luciferase